MSELRNMLLDANERLLTDYCTKEVVLAAESGVWAATLWHALTEAGITNALSPEDEGGCGLGLGEALRLAGSAAAFSAPVPLGEYFLATWILACAGLSMPKGPATIAPTNLQDQLVLQREGRQWRLTGIARRIPWARYANSVVVLARFEGKDSVAVVPASRYSIKPGGNIALEARDTLAFNVLLAENAVAPAIEGLGRIQQHALGAALRTVQMASALAHTLEVSVRYAQDRVQFGRPISKFQAVQHNLAVLASQAAAAHAAADIALESLEPEIDLFNIGAAKARAGEAASIGAAVAHQVHGAIGFTKEYELNLSTRRLWSWRDEFGNEVEWSLSVGRNIAAAGADRLWATITSAGSSNPTRAGIGEKAHQL